VPDRGSVRRARVTELDDLRAIEIAAGAPFRDLGMDAIADDTPPSTVVLRGGLERDGLWVLEVDGAPVAYLLDDVVDGHAHVEQVSVDPAHAGHGYGRRLVEHLAGRARAAGRDALTLTTFTEVPWNGPYYVRLGFRALADDELGPGLRAVRRAETARGLDRWRRAAMIRDL
jgi:GNAT superfamily N-acetyltransferase